MGINYDYLGLDLFFVNDILLREYKIIFHKMKEIEKWISWGKQNKKMIFFYQQHVLDLTEFVFIHPGGRKALSSYLYKDITDILFAVYPHKKQNTLETLNKYVIGTNTSFSGSLKAKKQSSNGNKLNRNKKKVCFQKSEGNNQQIQGEVFDNGIVDISNKQPQTTISQSKRPQKKKHSSKNKKYQVSLTIIPDKTTPQDKITSKKSSKVRRNDIDSNIDLAQMEELNQAMPVPLFKVNMAKER